MTLIVVMLILVVVMILGVGGAQIALLGERSTRYDRDYLIASQAAEAALMDAEFDIAGPNNSGGNRVAQFTQASTGAFKDNCAGTGTSLGLCNPTLPGTTPVWAAVDFTDATKTVTFGQFTGRSYASQPGLSVGIQPALWPHYIIEVVPDMAIRGDASVAGQKIMYRITAMGFGPRQDVQVVMQTSFRK
ncbi:MAG: hypothetical protein JSR59_15355 [Proteobacteria bacterium]|nr:hypothetical protein [Pseudomonadota bacterium]